MVNKIGGKLTNGKLNSKKLLRGQINRMSTENSYEYQDIIYVSVFACTRLLIRPVVIGLSGKLFRLPEIFRLVEIRKFSASW